MAITPIDLVLRLVKGSAVTASENDDNLTNLKTACEELDSQKEPADATILKDADIGVSVQAYDATILVDADIGVSVQGYNADTTTAGNTFNGVSQLVQTDGAGKLPAIDGSNLLNLPSGFADPMTTRGDIIYRNASNVTDRLGIGTSGQVVGTSDGTDITWITPAGGGDLLSTNNLSDVANAATSRSNLGLEIGVDVQAYDAGLASIAGLTTLADRMIYTTASDTYAVATLTAAGRALLDDADASAQRTTLGLAIGTDVQAYDADTAKTDVTQTFTAPQRGTLTTDNDGSFDMNVTNRFKCTPTGNFTLTFTNISSQGGVVILDNSGGHTISADTAVKVDSYLLNTISTAGVYVLGYESDGTNVYITGSLGLA